MVFQLGFVRFCFLNLDFLFQFWCIFNESCRASVCQGGRRGVWPALPCSALPFPAALAARRRTASDSAKKRSTSSLGSFRPSVAPHPANYASTSDFSFKPSPTQLLRTRVGQPDLRSDLAYAHHGMAVMQVCTRTTWFMWPSLPAFNCFTFSLSQSFGVRSGVQRLWAFSEDGSETS